MSELTNIPDRDTISGLITDLMALMARQSPEAIADRSLDSFNLDKRFIVEALRRCFGVEVPVSEFRADFRSFAQLAHGLGTYVQAELTNRKPVTESALGPTERLLLVGTVARGIEQAIARRGWSATALIHYDLLGRELQVGVAGVIDEIEAADWGRPPDVVQRIIDLYAAGRIKRVVPVAEFALLPAALATTQLGIPGPSLRSVCNTRNKVLMRRTLEQAGLAQVRYTTCSDCAQAQVFLDRVGGPIILKPVSGTGSDGVSLVKTKEELGSAFKVAAGSDGFTGIFCEEYIEGPEVSLEGYSVGGRFIPVALTDKLTDERFLEIGHQQPTSHPQSVFEAAVDLAARSLAALGITDGVTHTEFRISHRGPVLIETHTRMGGDHIDVLTHLTTGVDLADLIVAFSLGETVDVRPVPQGRAAAIRFLIGQPGVVSGGRLPAKENGIHTVVIPPVGRVVSGRSSSRDRLGHVIATGVTPEVAARTAESFIAQIHIDYFNGGERVVAAPERVAAVSSR